MKLPCDGLSSPLAAGHIDDGADRRGRDSGSLDEKGFVGNNGECHFWQRVDSKERKSSVTFDGTVDGAGAAAAAAADCCCCRLANEGYGGSGGGSDGGRDIELPQLVVAFRRCSAMKKHEGATPPGPGPSTTDDDNNNYSYYQESRQENNNNNISKPF